MAICSNSRIIFRKRKGRDDEYRGISCMEKYQDVVKHVQILCNGWR